MDSQFAKILKLIKLTGEKVVVIKNDQEFVVTNLDDYFRLIQGSHPIAELSESQMLDKINRDIALWRESQKELFTEVDDFIEPITETRPYYTPLKQTAQAEIDKLNDAIDNEMLMFKNNQETLQNFSDNKSILDEFKFNSSFKEEENNFNNKFNNKLEEDNKFDTENIPFFKGITDFDNTDNQVAEDFDHYINNYKDRITKEFDQQDKSSHLHKNDKPKNNQHKSIKQKDNLIKTSQPKVNNFGYLNPSDTENKKSNLKLSTQNNSTLTDFSNIPPPPDVKK